jgi:hypothetical protein
MAFYRQLERVRRTRDIIGRQFDRQPHQFAAGMSTAESKSHCLVQAELMDMPVCEMILKMVQKLFRDHKAECDIRIIES